MAISLDQFGKSLVASGLLTAEELKKLWERILPEARPTDGDSFAQLLVAEEKLTPFQAQELIAGRGARLIMGDYVILAEIGAGGMGQVYKARHRRMKRFVAIKVMSNAAMQDPAAVKRFQREVLAAAKLEHPNIITAYDSGEVGSVKYLVMQFVDGGDLSELVKKHGRLDIERAVGYVIQAAQGLAYAHGESVIHRDIKPANLLLDRSGVVKILDMGLARIEGGDGLTATEQVMGTVDYMSPEQAGDTKHVDARADVYALGCTLWYLLTAAKLYDGNSMVSRLMKHRDAPLPSLVKERDDAPWPLEQVLHKMIAKRPQDRYQSMDEVVAALAPFAGSASSGHSRSAVSADLTSFMQSMESGASPSKSTATQSKPGSAARHEAAARLAAFDVGTDPSYKAPPAGVQVGQSGSSTSLSSVAKNQSHSQHPTSKQGSGNLFKVAASGMLVFAVVIVGFVLMPRKQEEPVVADPSDGSGASLARIPPPQATVAKPSQPIVPTPSPASPGKPTVTELLESPDYVWSAPENLGPLVNSDSVEQAPTLTADLLCLIFLQPAGGSDLLEARRTGIDSPWGRPVRLTGGDHERDPSLSPDGLTLVYCSNAWKNSGYLGGYDIWFRRRTSRDAPWGPPQNIGEPVNSVHNEGGPTISNDGLMLAFHASRPGGYGNSNDLWLSRRATPTAPWGVPENLGTNINSPGSDMNPRFIDGDKSIFFERSGTLFITFRNSIGVNGAISLPKQPEKFSWPWISPDGTMIYYHATDRPGGLGKDDLWLIRRVSKSRL